MDAFDILLVSTFLVWLYYRPLVRRSGKIPRNDLATTADGVRQVLFGNLAPKDDPNFALRRV